ncbi:MAG: hypothetical protein QNJ46_10935 [Leptolyngbyaceae cyanobacterium MO_188.B28]|nr:hypothetical protein [Leptolyngbyaceae cyanobacterium MO_188.B28]
MTTNFRRNFPLNVSLPSSNNIYNRLKRLLFLLALPLLILGCDTLRVDNSAGEVGALVDGEDSGNVVNDQSESGNGSGQVSFTLDNLESASAPNRNEVIVFGEDRAPRRESTPWTSDQDEFTIALGNRLSVPVTVWIVQGPFADQRDHAIDACIRTSTIWDSERMGIRFSEFKIRDATSDPDIDNDILNSTGGDSRNWDDFSNDIGFEADRVNIYWINTVEGSTTTGWSDFGGRIVMGRNTGDELLSHELGHAVSLFHPDSCGDTNPNFDTTNVMWPCSSIREFLTEGQIFRSHFNSASSINDLYNARTGEPTVSCSGAANTAECPALEKRIWDDGAFPAN